MHERERKLVKRFGRGFPQLNNYENLENNEKFALKELAFHLGIDLNKNSTKEEIAKLIEKEITSYRNDAAPIYSGGNW